MVLASAAGPCLRNSLETESEEDKRLAQLKSHLTPSTEQEVRWFGPAVGGDQAKSMESHQRIFHRLLLP